MNPSVKLISVRLLLGDPYGEGGRRSRPPSIGDVRVGLCSHYEILSVGAPPGQGPSTGTAACVRPPLGVRGNNFFVGCCLGILSF